jgi:hypothetical protein
MCDFVLVLVLELVLDRSAAPCTAGRFYPGSFRCDRALPGPLVNFEDEDEFEYEFGCGYAALRPQRPLREACSFIKWVVLGCRAWDDRSVSSFPSATGVEKEGAHAQDAKGAQ